MPLHGRNTTPVRSGLSPGCSLNHTQPQGSGKIQQACIALLLGGIWSIPYVGQRTGKQLRRKMGSGLLWAQVHPNQRHCQPWPATGPGAGPGKFLGTRAASSIRGPGRYQHMGTRLSLEALGRTKHQCGGREFMWQAPLPSPHSGAWFRFCYQHLLVRLSRSSPWTPADTNLVPTWVSSL